MHAEYILLQQQCIPVGCVPSAAVAVCWGEGGVCPGGVCLGQVVSSRVGVGVCPGGCVCQTPPHEQNDRHLRKHYLALTTLRTVVNMYPALVGWTCM